MTETRRLAAIVSADVAGYSRLMGQDESGTLAALKAIRRELVDPKVAQHHGRIVKTTGDGLLLEFASVVDAVRCAIEVQAAMTERVGPVPEDRRILFRVGINVGDIISDGDDIFGDGVNLAARLQEIAAPGGLCVSARVHDDVRDRLDAAFTDGGEPQLKNIARAPHIWRWSPARSLAPTSFMTADAAPPLPDRPSIAVLPFANMSGDAEQGYFADGVAEDIITALSRFQSLFVIARNSSFSYRGQEIDVRKIGRELGVRYLLEGSVRKGGNRVRVTGQLIEAATGNHLWAEQYDGDLTDIFALQDRITEAVAGAIAPTIQRAEIERARRSPPRNLDAYDLYLRGLPLYLELTPDSSIRALDLFEQASRADPTFALAPRMVAACWLSRLTQGWEASRYDAAVRAMDYALRALRLAPDNDDFLAHVAFLMVVNRGEGVPNINLDDAVAMAARAVALNPNSISAYRNSGLVHMYTGPPETAILHFEHALRLSPRDSQLWTLWGGMAQTFLQVGRDQDAIAAAQASLRYAPKWAFSWRVLAGALGLAGRLEQARSAATTLLQLYPTFRAGTYRAFTDRIKPSANARLFDGLRLAGLPE